MGTSVANLDVTQYVKVNSTHASITLQSSRDAVRVALSNVKPSLDNSVFHTLGGDDNPLQFLNIESDVWVLATSVHSNLVVTETDTVGKKDWYAEIIKGNVPGHSIVSVQGENLDVDVASPENLWGAGGRMVYPVAGEQWRVSSDNVNDSLSGDGAQIVAVHYLDVNYEEQVELVEMNGVSPVTMTATNCFRPISVTTVQAGSTLSNTVQSVSTQSNTGAITVFDSVTGNPRLDMQPLYNRSLHGFFTVPAGKTGYFIYGHSALGKNKDGKIDLYITSGDNGIFIKNSFADLFQNSVVFLPKAPIGQLTEKTDIQFICTTLNNNTDASAFVQMLLVDNE